MSDPTLVYIVSWTHMQSNYRGPVSYVVRMKESQAKRIEEILEKNVEAEHLYNGTIEEAGELMDAKGILEILKKLPGSEKEWMP